MKTFHIITESNGEFNFITSAVDQKQALGNLILNSDDFKQIVKRDNDMVITIKEYKPKK